jgi:hypothetical protein
VLAFLAAVSEAMAIEEAEGVVPGGLERKLAQLRQAALPYLERSPR